VKEEEPDEVVRPAKKAKTKASERTPSKDVADKKKTEELKVGEIVEYFGKSQARWITARVLNVRSDGCVDLDVKPRAARENVRKRKIVKEEESADDGSGLKDADEGSGEEDDDEVSEESENNDDSDGGKKSKKKKKKKAKGKSKKDGKKKKKDKD